MIHEKSDDKTHSLRILLQQYSECWADVRAYSNSLWQITAVLIAVVAFLGLLYGHYLKASQIWRITILLLACGFTSVSVVALTNHRFLSKMRFKDLEYIQNRLGEKFPELKEIQWRTKDLAKDYLWIYRISAFRCQLGFSMAILVGILVLLLNEVLMLLGSL